MDPLSNVKEYSWRRSESKENGLLFSTDLWGLNIQNCITQHIPHISRGLFFNTSTHCCVPLFVVHLGSTLKIENLSLWVILYTGIVSVQWWRDEMLQWKIEVSSATLKGFTTIFTPLTKSWCCGLGPFRHRNLYPEGRRRWWCPAGWDTCL